VNENELFPIYGLWHKPFWQTMLFHVIIITVLVSIFLIVLYYFLKKYINKRVKKTAWDKALCDFSELQKLLLKKKISPKDFYLSLTSILKVYFFNLYGYNLLGKTDDEVILFLEENKFDKDLLLVMRELFNSLQFVKFANASALQENMERDILKCFDIVKKTIPVR